MDFYSMTDEAVLTDLGQRFRALRLRKNLTQDELARRSAMSVTAIKSLESGRTRLATAIAVLRELGQLEALDQFIPEPAVSPMQVAKLGGKKRQRASRRHGQPSPEGPAGSEW
jgi:transcriptional regulator with XRE-family HTH domain